MSLASGQLDLYVYVVSEGVVVVGCCDVSVFVKLFTHPVVDMLPLKLTDEIINRLRLKGEYIMLRGGIN